MSYEVISTVEDSALVEKRRKQIVDAATALFSAQGFFRTTIKDIAKLAGISPGLVYQYVTDKEDVLLLVLLEVVDAYARELPVAVESVTDPLDRCVAAIVAYCRVVDTHRAATVLAYRSTKSLSEERRVIIQRRETETNQIITDVITECVRKGYFRRVNVDVLTYQIVMTAHAWALKSWHFKTILKLEDYIEHSLDILLKGVLTPSVEKRWHSIPRGVASVAARANR